MCEIFMLLAEVKDCNQWYYQHNHFGGSGLKRQNFEGNLSIRKFVVCQIGGSGLKKQNFEGNLSIWKFVVCQICEYCFKTADSNNQNHKSLVSEATAPRYQSSHNHCTTTMALHSLSQLSAKLVMSKSLIEVFLVHSEH